MMMNFLVKVLILYTTQENTLKSTIFLLHLITMDDLQNAVFDDSV